MVPELVPDKVPIVTGAVKLPLLSESCAVKILPALKFPMAVKGTATADPGHRGR